MNTKIDVQAQRAYSERYFDTLVKMQIIGGLIALGAVSLLGRRKMIKDEKSRGSLFNIIFCPHTTNLARGGQTRKPRRASRPRLRGLLKHFTKRQYGRTSAWI